MTPSPDELARQLEVYRDYLALLARVHLSRALQGKVDPSGVVQQTLLEAHQLLAQTPVPGEDDRLALLRRVLANNLTDEVRRATRARRDAARERSLHAEVEHTSACLAALLPDTRSSPSAAVARREEVGRLSRALASLPDAQRQAVELHHLHGCPLAEVAERLALSKPAVAGLLHRGLRRLRVALEEEA